jgi:hypothetical protein
MRKHPSRWHNCPSFYEFFHRLLLNTATPESIAANANLEAIVAYEKKTEEQRQRRAVEKQKEYEHESALQNELGQEIEKAEAAEQVGGKVGGIFEGLVENPLKPILYPIQQQLRQAVYAGRIAKSVVLWREPYYAFWIATACFLVSAVTIWIPWGFILRWLLRLVVLAGLGPWMAIVDRLYFAIKPDMTNEEKDEELRQRLRARYEQVLRSATNYFIRKERAIKIMSMKKYMFGRHAVRVPRFSEDLYDDIPLPSSTCAPVDADSAAPIRMEEVKFGQNLSGDMIPKREMQVAKHNVTGKKKQRIPFWKDKKGTIPDYVPLLGTAAGEKTSGEHNSAAATKKTD